MTHQLQLEKHSKFPLAPSEEAYYPVATQEEHGDHQRHSRGTQVSRCDFKINPGSLSQLEMRFDSHAATREDP